MSQQQEQEQPKKGVSINDLTDLINPFFFMNIMDSRNKSHLNKTISKPEIKKKIPDQIPCLQCKRRMVDNSATYDGVDRGYCPKCWGNR
jgi:hypothetical protein